MMLYRNQYRIESARLLGWDYSTDGFYFVTICTKNRYNFFGEIKHQNVILNEIGEYVKAEWLKTRKIRKNIILDEFVVMPNHFHAIIAINNSCDFNINHNVHLIDDTLQNESSFSHKAAFCTPVRKSNLSNVIRGFKSSSTKKIHVLGYNDFAWQSRFYDRIIRNETELNNIRNYIIYNPLKWGEDEYYQ